MSAGVPPMPSAIRSCMGVFTSTGKGMASAASATARSTVRASAFGARITITSLSVMGQGSSVTSARPLRRYTEATPGMAIRRRSSSRLARSTASRLLSEGTLESSMKARSSRVGRKLLPRWKAIQRQGIVSPRASSRTWRPWPRAQSRAGR